MTQRMKYTLLLQNDDGSESYCIGKFSASGDAYTAMTAFTARKDGFTYLVKDGKTVIFRHKATQ